MPTPERLFQVKRALLAGMTEAEVSRRSLIDPWFIGQLGELLAAEREWSALWADQQVAWTITEVEERAAIRRMKRLGFSDRQLADLRGMSRGRTSGTGARRSACRPDLQDGRHLRRRVPFVHSVSLLVATTRRTKAAAPGDRTVVILGSGPNRIGQGVEFDYCCVRATLKFREMGYKTVMVNSNPETVSTDFDMSDTLYFEPLTLEDVLEIVHVEKPIGVVVQLGRPDAAAAGARAREGRGADPRHLARGDRPGRGSRAVRADRARAGRAAAAGRYRDHPARGRKGGAHRSATRC